jgi:hypothetical protein
MHRVNSMLLLNSYFRAQSPSAARIIILVMQANTMNLLVNSNFLKLAYER